MNHLFFCISIGYYLIRLASSGIHDWGWGKQMICWTLTNCCPRPKAEGNTLCEGPTKHLLPENPFDNYFVIPHCDVTPVLVKWLLHISTLSAKTYLKLSKLTIGTPRTIWERIIYCIHIVLICLVIMKRCWMKFCQLVVIWGQIFVYLPHAEQTADIPSNKYL